MAHRPTRPALTADQKADADRLHAALLEAAAGDLRTLAESLAATTDATIFGATEFAVRDLVLRSAATALADRAEKVTTGAVAGAPPATARPSSNGGNNGSPSPCSAPSG